MKAKSLFLLPAVILALNLLPVGRVSAQTFTTLHSFSAWSPDDGLSGDGPDAGLILTNNTLYGTVRSGGTAGYGMVFAITTAGTGFMVLHNFTGSDGFGPTAGLLLSGNTLYGTTAGANLGLPYWGGSTVFAVNTDGTSYTDLFTFRGTADYLPYVNLTGAQPMAGLILSGATLYGTAYFGGTSGNGTVFALRTNGTSFTVLHSGDYPQAGLILSGNTLYGTTSGGYWGGLGSVFAVNTNGTGFTVLHAFTGGSDGSEPQAGLILSGNTLYGTASYGGTSDNGTVFAVSTNGTGFTVLHAFTGGNDGSEPQAGLILSGNTLYGTASYGGTSDNGTVFAVSTNGTGFTVLHAFTGGNDGSEPQAGLILSGNTLYGTASYGGTSGNGTVFAVSTNGTGITNLHNFTGSSDGATPRAGLILSGNTFYGTTSLSGSSGGGTVFSLSFRPQLTIAPSGRNVILSWPTNIAGFDYTGYRVQSTTNPGSSAVWSTNSPAPVVLAGRDTVTMPVASAQQFYRLAQ